MSWLVDYKTLAGIRSPYLWSDLNSVVDIIIHSHTYSHSWFSFMISGKKYQDFCEWVSLSKIIYCAMYIPLKDSYIDWHYDDELQKGSGLLTHIGLVDNTSLIYWKSPFQFLRVTDVFVIFLIYLCPPPKGRGTYCFWCGSRWCRH